MSYEHYEYEIEGYDFNDPGDLDGDYVLDEEYQQETLEEKAFRHYAC